MKNLFVKKCPNCRYEIPTKLIRNEFSCPNCSINLASNKKEIRLRGFWLFPIIILLSDVILEFNGEVNLYYRIPISLVVFMLIYYSEKVFFLRLKINQG